MTDSTSQKKSSGAAAAISTLSSAGAIIFPAWLSSAKPLLRAFSRASSFLAFSASFLRCSRTLLMDCFEEDVPLDLLPPSSLPSLLGLPLPLFFAVVSIDDMPFFVAFLFLFLALVSSVVAALRFIRDSALTSSSHSRSENTFKDLVDISDVSLFECTTVMLAALYLLLVICL